MRKLLFLILIFSTPAYASEVVCFDVGGNPQKALQYIKSVNTQEYLSRTDCVINPNLSSLSSVPLKYWKHSSGLIIEMTSQEKIDFDNAQTASQTLSIRTRAKAQLTGFADSPLYQRAFADILKDEINILRGWTVNFKAEVAAASNLADLKTRVAGLPTLNDRTLSQLKIALQSRVDSGQVD